MEGTSGEDQDRTHGTAGRETALPESQVGPDAEVDRRAPIELTQFGKRSWWAVLKGTVKESQDDELTDRAAALTRYGVLSLFPALLVLVSLLGLAGKSATDQVLEKLRKLAPGSARDIISDAVTQLQGRGGVGS
ncbi:hypothetical protein GCM10018789_59700 [Streptomyces werraensis]|nr:hypothetical protein GCM10018789_59700 [Streptomyces werraensis]